VKYGVSKHDEPWSRLQCHATSKDNPFGMRITPVAFASVQFPYVKAARVVENSLKAYATRTLSRVPRSTVPYAMSMPVYEQHACSPSGEWLVHPGDDNHAIEDFYSLAMLALRHSIETKRYFHDLLGQAYERLYRAAVAYHEGSGYVELSVRRIYGHRGGEVWL